MLLSSHSNGLLGGGWLAFILLRKNLVVTGHIISNYGGGGIRVSNAGANCYVLRNDH